MQNAHGHTWECRAPSHDPLTFDQEIEYQEHSIKEHGVPETHVAILSRAARRPALNEILECPFGDDFQPLEKADPSAVFSCEALQSHVAAHIKEIALLTLQKLPSDADDNAENVDSDQPLEDDGPGFAKLRASMYSILDDESLDLQNDDTEDMKDISDHVEEQISASVTILDLEDKDDAGMTKLHHAVQAGNMELIRSLIHRGANLGSKDNSGRTALHYASMKQSHGPDIMALILSAGGKAIMNQGDDNGQTALHYAAEMGFTDNVRILVDHGVDINTTDIHGFSPLLWAVVAEQKYTTEMLLAIGADTASTSAGEKSALAWAAGFGCSSIVQLLLSHAASTYITRNTQAVPLEEAAASGDLFTVKLLLTFGYDLNYQGHDGWSAIHWAAEEGYLNIVQWLLVHGANVNAVSSYGTSPLHCAANGGHTFIVDLLLKNGVDPLKSTCHGWTALHHAAYMGHSEVVKRLLEYDCTRSSASQQDNHGWSALHLAVHSRDLITIKILLDVIAEPSAMLDENGLTAIEWLDLEPNSHSYKATSNLAFAKSRCCRAMTGLQQAVSIGSVPLIRLLLKRYHINSTNSGRRTALYYAAKKRMLPIMDLLLEGGADPNILPTGRKTWREFISDEDVIVRLNRAGYKEKDTDPEIMRQIQISLRAQGRRSAPDRSATFVPDEPISPSPAPDSLFLSTTAVSKSPLPDHLAPNIPSGSLTPTGQTYDNKRKTKSDWSGVRGFWKRMLR